ALGSRLLRCQSAATRHLVWGVAFVAALAMPALLVLVPGWEVPVLPAEAVALWEAVPEPMPAGEVMGVTLPEAATPALPLNLLLLLLWAAGAALVLARWLAGVAGAVVLTMRARPLDEPAWREATAQAARRLGLRRPVTLRVSAALRQPAAVGRAGGPRPLVVHPAGVAGLPPPPHRTRARLRRPRPLDGPAPVGLRRAPPPARAYAGPRAARGLRPPPDGAALASR